MSRRHRIADAITTHARVVVVAFLLATAVVGVGVTALETDPSLEQFRADSPEASALEYADRNFEAATANTTTVQLVLEDQDGDALARESLIAGLQFQQSIRKAESVEGTLAAENPTVGVENVVATAAVREREAAELEAEAADLEARGEALTETTVRLEATLDQVRELQREYESLNESRANGTIDEKSYERRAEAIEDDLETAVENATADLEDDQTTQFEGAVARIVDAEGELAAIERAYAAGEIDARTYDRRTDRLEEAIETATADGTVGVLDDEYAALRETAERLEQRRADLESLEQPPLDEQIAALESLSETEYETILERALDGEGPGNDAAVQFLPSSYEPGSTTADARMVVVTQTTDPDVQGPTTAHDRLVESQLEIRELAEDREEEYAVFGFGIVADEIDRSIDDSLAIVGPLAVAFVVVALLIAYRDPIDVALGIAGTIAVLVWTFGVAGWAGIAFNQTFVAIPVLLVGLSIDYAIHVFMRYREHREALRASDRASGPSAREHRETPRVSELRTGSGATREDESGVRNAMTVALAGVGVAFVWVTTTTTIGFLATLTSPVAPIREFGVVSAVGILSALLVFGVVLPAAKVELDAALERHGIDRHKRAIGTGDRAATLLSAGTVAARRVPLVVLACVLLITAGAVYAAADVDTSVEEDELLVEQPPAWTESMPGPFEPGTYGASEDLEVLESTFQREDATGQIVVRGNVTDGETLQRVARAETEAAEADTIYTLPTGEADVRSPLSAVDETAREDDSLEATVSLADRTDDGVPDQNLEGVYDRLFAADSETASDVVYRTETGEYEAIRLVVAVRGDADPAEAATELRAIAATIDDDDRLTAVATDGPVLTTVVEEDVHATVQGSLVLSVLVVVAVLAVAYRATGTRASLAAVTILPVALAVAWVVGTMALLSIPFNAVTGMIASLTVGIGVAYSIHVSSRYVLELERRETVRDALETTIAGTGGAVLASAVTTVGGVGTLAVAILPVLRQFGVITALSIAYAFLASVFVLPTLLVLWTRYLGPDVSLEDDGSSCRRDDP
ncbi:efflux RND transporter permease subunit [Natrialbaceae archaeon AArc-T1-2]|uniref:efflux RND transporter permease subunit n=1 Tax=Natrialbaceae archaeon AArc-T1-2 TaxID=3053904 RepID=UPI00255AF04A|nr:MMPL family transporter [Natrialbaceae archaeon AArc-T1-2]WIV67204.1 MMPL family transporter [Natrialbaceae archaeon AArc-T1-2]